MPTTPDIFDVAPTPPAWTAPDTEPDWNSLAHDGAGILSWVRDTGATWIACEDRIDEEGQWVRSPAAIHYSDAPPDGLDAAAARRFAGELLAAADLLDPPATGR